MARTESSNRNRVRGHSTNRNPANSDGMLSESRRLMTMIFAIIMLLVALMAWLLWRDSTGTFVAAACGRVGLVLAALWLAWPSLRRPANWLPASVPVIGVVALIVVAAQPRLILPAIPIVGVLITLSMFVKAFRKA